MRQTLRFLFLMALNASAVAQVVSVEDAVDMALEKNYDILVQRAVAASAMNDNRFAYGAFLPQPNAIGSYTKTVNNSNNLPFPSSSNPNPVESPHTGIKISNPSGTAQLYWPIFDGTKMFATRKRIAELANLAGVNVKTQ